MKIGDWVSTTDCISTGDDPSCGPGTVVQTRKCRDGTLEKCSDQETKRSLWCSLLEQAPPDCKGT